jgi:hypothetical protein
MGENLILECKVAPIGDNGLEIKLEDALEKEKGEAWKNVYEYTVPPNIMEINKDEGFALVRISLERRDSNE